MSCANTEVQHNDPKIGYNHLTSFITYLNLNYSFTNVIIIIHIEVIIMPLYNFRLAFSLNLPTSQEDIRGMRQGFR